MEKSHFFIRSICFIFLSSLGGFVFSFTTLSIGWMIGTLLLAALISFYKPKLINNHNHQKGLPSFWMYLGQSFLAIELGQKINISFIEVFRENWISIISMLLLSILFSLLSGFILWRLTDFDMITCFFGATPGGLSAMPSIAEEIGANTMVVTVIQTMRVFLVVLLIPLFASIWLTRSTNDLTVNHAVVFTTDSPFEITQLLWTLLLIVGVCGGYYVGKYLRFPAPWLVGGMLGVGCVQTMGSALFGTDLKAWWPPSMMVLSQIFIAACIGSRFDKEMIVGMTKTLVVSFFTTIGLILSLFFCAYFISHITGISLVTSVLAFTPGGIAEMTTTSAVLNADSTFVVVVQVLRIVVVLVILPPVFRLLKRWEAHKIERSRTSA